MNSDNQQTVNQMWKLRDFTVNSVEITGIYSNCTLFWQKFRESDGLHTVDFTKFLYHDFLKNFRENNFFSKEFTI